MITNDSLPLKNTMVQKKTRWNPFFGWNDFVQTTLIKNQQMGWKQKKKTACI